jgi:hypothetical protein
MAGILAVAQTGNLATGTALKTLAMIKAAANHRCKAHEFSVSFEGVTVTDAPILVQIYRPTTDGTMSSLTPKKIDDDAAETLQTVAYENASAEPTIGDILFSQYVHPQGEWTYRRPFGKEIVVRGGQRLAIAVTAITGVDVVARIEYEE